MIYREKIFNLPFSKQTPNDSGRTQAGWKHGVHPTEQLQDGRHASMHSLAQPAMFVKQLPW